MRVERVRRLTAGLILAALGACVTPAPEPAELSAPLPGGPGMERETAGFSSPDTKSRFCLLRDPTARIRFDGSWQLGFSARCERRRRYGGCVCEARLLASEAGVARFESEWQRFDLPAESEWTRIELEGRARAIRFAYPQIDAVTLTVLEREPAR